MDEVPNFKPHQIYNLGESFSDLENWLETKEFQSMSVLEKLRAFESKLKTLVEDLNLLGWLQSESWILKELKEIKKDIEACLNLEKTQVTTKSNYQFQQRMSSLRNRILWDLNLFPVVLLPDLPSRIPRSALEAVSNMFDQAIYTALPAIAKRDFQEAADCYLHGQSTAAVVLTWRAMEATLREYYCRLKKVDYVGGPWGDVVRGLEGSAPNSIIKHLQLKKDDRNKFAHPQKIASREYALRQIEQSRNLASELVEDWVKKNKALSIGVPSINMLPIQFETFVDIGLAVFLLERHGGGIGRIKYFESPDYDPSEYDYIVGMFEGLFRHTSKCISIDMLAHFEVRDGYEAVIEFVQKLRSNPGGIIVQSSKPEQTLQAILRAIKLRAKNSHEFYNQIQSLFTIIQDNKPNPLNPFDEYFAHELPNGFSDLVIQISVEDKEINTAWDLRLDVEFNGEQAVIIESRKLRFQELMDKAFENKYDIVVLTDPLRSKSILLKVKKGSTIYPSEFVRSFKSATKRDFLCDLKQLESKGKVILTKEDIKCILDSTLGR
ncbi:MAG: hypothetical protein DWQ04_03105 [Chloroflexi bacterium]|nr:MAG: hypothetical protein DWQ04_03105 [Chloroflexota bacterium]